MKFTWWPSSIWSIVAVVAAGYMLGEHRAKPEPGEQMCQAFGNVAPEYLRGVHPCEPMVFPITPDWRGGDMVPGFRAQRYVGTRADGSAMYDPVLQEGETSPTYVHSFIGRK